MSIYYILIKEERKNTREGKWEFRAEIYAPSPPFPTPREIDR